MFTHQGGVGVMQPPLKTKGLKPFKEESVVKCDGVSSYELLHAMLSLTVTLKKYINEGL